MLLEKNFSLASHEETQFFKGSQLIKNAALSSVLGLDRRQTKKTIDKPDGTRRRLRVSSRSLIDDATEILRHSPNLSQRFCTDEVPNTYFSRAPMRKFHNRSDGKSELTVKARKIED